MISSYLYLVVFLALPFSWAQQCVPDLCPFRCCANSDTCASSIFECEACDPKRCLSGCCAGRVCAVSSDACDSSGNGLVFAAIVLVVVFSICVLGICFRRFKKSRARTAARLQRSNIAVPVEPTDRQDQPELSAPPVIIPILEAETESYKPTYEVPVVDNEIVTGIVEIDHAVFLKQQVDNKEALYKMGLVAQQFQLSQGTKPDTTDNIPKRQI